MGGVGWWCAKSFSCQTQLSLNSVKLFWGCGWGWGFDNNWKQYYYYLLRRFHPHFKNVMQSRISQLMGINYKFDLLLSEDGSGRGAALVAAVLKR